MKKILVIEKLNLGTFLLTLPISMLFKKIICLQSSPILKSKLFPQGNPRFNYHFFDYKNVSDDICEIVKDGYELTEQVYSRLKKEGTVLELLKKINKNEKLELAIKKLLINNIENFSCNIHCLKYIQATLADSSSVNFLPYNYFYFKEFKSFMGCNVPDLWTTYLYVMEYSARLIKPFIYFQLFLLKIIKSGKICFKKYPRVEKDIGYSIHSFYEGDYLKTQYNHSFIYNDLDFKKEKILHFLDFAKPSKKSAEYLDKNKIEYACYEEEKIPISFFVNFIIFKYVLSLLIKIPSLFLREKNYSHYTLATMNVVHETLLMTSFFDRYRVKVHITRDDYNPRHVVRTVLLNQHGGKTIGFMHGGSIGDRNCYAYLHLNSYLVWGKINLIYQKYFIENIEKVKVIGPYRSDYVHKHILSGNKPSEVKNLSSNQKIIAVFDDISESVNPNVFSRNMIPYSINEFLGNHQDDFGATRLAFCNKQYLNDFMQGIKELIENHEDAYFLIKPKLKLGKYAQEYYSKMLDTIKDRFQILDGSYPLYDLIGSSDIIVTFSISVAFESLCSGKKTLFYEPYSDISKRYPQMKLSERYGGMIFCRDNNDLQSGFKNMMNGEYIHKNNEQKLINILGRKMDGLGVERIREGVRELLGTNNSASKKYINEEIKESTVLAEELQN